jgi:N6-adenosine-specific RNA methylase IME4
MTARAPAKSIQRQSEGPPLPPGPFDVIYADPPWRYDFSRSQSRSILSHYDNLPIEDVCAIPVSSAGADDSVPFLWAAAPKLPEALRVVELRGRLGERET